MAKSNTDPSVEPLILNLGNGWLQSYKLDYKPEQEPIGNSEIDNAFNEYYSKSGGKGGNRPDAKLLLTDSYGNSYPVLIEYKGHKDRLAKFDSNSQVANKTAKNEPDFNNIKTYALNGAVHYANAILHYTSFENIIAIGMTGYKDSFGTLQHEIAVYLVSKSNFGIGQKVGDYTDFSFLKKENFEDFIKKVKELSLTEEEKEKIKKKLDEEISTSLTKLNNDIYKNESGLGENDRVYLVTASIIATLGVAGKVAPLEKSELKSKDEEGSRDGDIMMRKVKAFLKEKDIPEDKRALIIRTLENTIIAENLNKVINGETQLKRIFSKIVDDLGIYYKTELSTDFTGKLFNEMYSWLGFTQDKLNDVVLTPSYVATLLARLARIDKDSFVWDFATGSAGLLVAAMNEMIKDATKRIKSPEELRLKIAKIKAEQILGLEILSSVYMLAILNMILMGDGSSNILNKDSLENFEGAYELGENKDKEFPATAFILNPPYSADGCGMIFVQKALSMMKKGYAAIIIQGSAGSGKAAEYNKKILERNTLIASIKMPIDLFIGKSSVQTYIYVFRVGERHEASELVKFIDFSNDGYSRANRKKAKASINLRDTDNAKERYNEVVELVRFGKSKLKIFTENEYYEDTIDPTKGNDWNKRAPIDTKPTVEDFKKTVADYLAWEVSNIIKKKSNEPKYSPSKERLEKVKWKEFKLDDLFYVERGTRFVKSKRKEGQIPLVTAGEQNQGIAEFITYDNKLKMYNNHLTIDMFCNCFYRNYNFLCDDNILVLFNKEKFSNKSLLFISNIIHRDRFKFGYNLQYRQKSFKIHKIPLPITNNGEIDFDFMESFISELEAERISELEAERISELEAYLEATGLKDTTLTKKEEEALNALNSLTWKEFRIGDLFDKLNLTFKKKKFKKEEDVSKINDSEFSLPLVNAKDGDNGIMYYGRPQDFESARMTIDIVNDGAVSTGNVYPQPQETGVLYNAYLIKAKFETSTTLLCFFSTTIQKSIKLKFSYELKASWERVKNEIIQIPTTEAGEIDFDFMETFVTAIQKECIRGVDNFLTSNLEATKEVIGN